jgi:hypothetical protein
MTTSAKEEQKLRKSLAGSTGSMTYNTYRDRAEAAIALEAQGRHAAAAKATVTGSARVPQVPRMPEGSPWAGDLVPPEEALGWSVEAQEPTGNYHEIEESLAASSAFHSLGAEDAEAARLGPLPSARPVPSGVSSPSSSDGTNSNVIAEPGLRRGRKL